MDGFVAEQIRVWNLFGINNHTLLADEAMYYYPEELMYVFRLESPLSLTCLGISEEAY